MLNKRNAINEELLKKVTGGAGGSEYMNEECEEWYLSIRSKLYKKCYKLDHSLFKSLIEGVIGKGDKVYTIQEVKDLFKQHGIDCDDL